MARSRVGGTRGLLSGKLGDYVYQITRDEKGDFQQTIYGYVPDPFNPSTDMQVCARASMACVERAMFTFYSAIYNSFENVPSGLMSINEFSRINYTDVRSYFDIMYDVEGDVDLIYDFPLKGQKSQRGGLYQISRGSLNQGIFWGAQTNSLGDPFYSVRSLVNMPGCTYGDFLKKHNLERGDIIDVLFFVEGKTDSYNFLGRFQILMSDKVSPAVLITTSNFRQIFQISSNVSFNAFWVPELGNFIIEWRGALANHNSYVSCDCFKLSRFTNGVWRFNTASMQATPWMAQGGVDWQTPNKVFTKWNQI